jgi:hypothetical protein
MIRCIWCRLASRHRVLSIIGLAFFTVFFGALVGRLAWADDGVRYLDQGWSKEKRQYWYEATQGSRLLPYTWATALEQADRAEPFFSDEHMRRLRYLPRKTSFGVSLPVGFVLDDAHDGQLKNTNLIWKNGQGHNEPWLGMNCSACHTGQLKIGGVDVRVDGAPTLGDFQGLMSAFNAALRATRDDAEKWKRFSAKVLGQNVSAADADILRKAFLRLVDWQDKIEKANRTPLAYGFGRLDAFGHIFNKVALLLGSNDGIANPSDAPVSYPFLWNIPQHDRVQWNGIATNSHFKFWPSGRTFDVLALGRNAGEVIGVFGDVNAEPFIWANGLSSSIHVENLIDLEQRLGSLLPPAWPVDLLPPLDAGLKQRGETLYRARCENCHKILDRTDLDSEIKAQMSLFRQSAGNTQPGTDPWMACNAYLYAARSGKFSGKSSDYFTGIALADNEKVERLLRTMVVGSIGGQKGELLASASANSIGVTRPPRVVRPGGLDEAEPETRAARLEKCMTEESNILGYKARPLNGIWATAPYLHNGSVPTLDDLLRAPDARPKSFFLGSREFDPIKVGYKTERSGENSFQFKTRDDASMPIPGNDNAGHDYGNAEFTDEDRKALIEYLKSL